MTPRVSAARALKKRYGARALAALLTALVCSVLAVNVLAYFYLFDDDWTPASRIAILTASFAAAAGLFVSALKRVGTERYTRSTERLADN